jgi:uncharacterized protein
VHTIDQALEPAPVARSAVRPTERAERISSLDVLRGVGLLGILLMNITGFGLPLAYNDPTNAGGAEGPNLLAWGAASMFFEGTMRGIFSMLFGAGVILLTSRAEARGGGIKVADIYYRRLLWLMLFGILHGYLLMWPGEILYLYSVIGMLMFPFRNMSAKGLMLFGCALLLIPASLNVVDYVGLKQLRAEAFESYGMVARGMVLDEDRLASIEEWNDEYESANPSPEKLDGIVEGHRGGYWTALSSIAPIVYDHQSVWAYEWGYTDVGGLMLLGMALLRLRVLTAERSYRFYLAMVLLGYGIGLPVNYYEMRLVIDGGFGPMAFAQSWVTYDLGRIPTMLGHTGLVLLVCKAGLFGWVTAGLAAVGRMALTNYVMHSAICMFVFTGVGWGLFGSLQRFELYYVVLGCYVANVVFSTLWLGYYRFGPLEWLWRSLTYWKRQPLRI